MAPFLPAQGDRYEGRFLEAFKCNTHAIAAENRAMLNAHRRSLEELLESPPSRPQSASSTSSRPRHGVAYRPASAPRAAEAKEPQSTKGLCGSLLSELFPAVGNSGSAGRGAHATSKPLEAKRQTQTCTDSGTIGKGAGAKHRPATAPSARRRVRHTVWPPFAVTGDISSAVEALESSGAKLQRPQSAPVIRVAPAHSRAPFAVITEGRPESAPAQKPGCGVTGQKHSTPHREQRRRSTSVPAARPRHRISSETIRQIARDAVCEALGQLAGHA